MKSLLLFLCLASFSFAADCTALTFTTLSELSQHTVPYQVWADDLGTDKASPSLDTVLSSWNQHFMLSPLECVYSTLNKVPVVSDRSIHLNIPYFWVGIVPAKFKSDPIAEGVHCAIAYFREDDTVDVVHRLHPDGIYFVENISRHDFFIRTTLIYEVTPRTQVPIIWKELPSELFK